MLHVTVLIICTGILYKNSNWCVIIRLMIIIISRFGNEFQEWTLLYKASRDGFSSKTFHQKCDGVNETYTIVQVRAQYEPLHALV